MLTPTRPQGTREQSIHIIDLFGFEANEVGGGYGGWRGHWLGSKENYLPSPAGQLPGASVCQLGCGEDAALLFPGAVCQHHARVQVSKLRSSLPSR